MNNYIYYFKFHRVPSSSLLYLTLTTNLRFYEDLVRNFFFTIVFSGLPWWLRLKNLPALQEIWVQFLDWENPMEKGMATHFSILAWRIPCTEEPGGLRFMRLQRVRPD